MTDIKNQSNIIMNNQAFLIDLEEDVTYVIYPGENVNKNIYDLPNLQFLNIADNAVKKMNTILFDADVDNILPYHTGDIEKEKEILITKKSFFKKYFKLVNILFIAFILLILYDIIFFISYQNCKKNNYLLTNNFIEILLNFCIYKQK